MIVSDEEGEIENDKGNREKEENRLMPYCPPVSNEEIKNGKDKENREKEENRLMPYSAPVSNEEMKNEKDKKQGKLEEATSEPKTMPVSDEEGKEENGKEYNEIEESESDLNREPDPNEEGNKEKEEIHREMDQRELKPSTVHAENKEELEEKEEIHSEMDQRVLKPSPVHAENKEEMEEKEKIHSEMDQRVLKPSTVHAENKEEMEEKEKETENSSDEYLHFGDCLPEEDKKWNDEPKKDNYVDEVKHFSYGYKYDPENEKTILLFGASQCGKSTLIDFFANYFKGIRSPKNKDVLVRVATNQENESAFTAYTFCAKDQAFTFIDSPNINDSKGFVKKDSKKLFSSFFGAVRESNRRINAFGFVVQNHFVRLSPAEDINMRFLISLLKDEYMSNIIPLITYADAQTPPVLDALKEYHINTDPYFSFNNVNLKKTKGEVTKLNVLYWEDGLENASKFLARLSELPPITETKQIVEDEDDDHSSMETNGSVENSGTLQTCKNRQNQDISQMIEDVIEKHLNAGFRFRCTMGTCQCDTTDIKGNKCDCRHEYYHHKPKESSKMKKEIKEILKDKGDEKSIDILNEVADKDSYSYKCCRAHLIHHYKEKHKMQRNLKKIGKRFLGKDHTNNSAMSNSNEDNDSMKETSKTLMHKLKKSDSSLSLPQISGENSKKTESSSNNSCMSNNNEDNDSMQDTSITQKHEIKKSNSFPLHLQLTGEKSMKKMPISNTKEKKNENSPLNETNYSENIMSQDFKNKNDDVLKEMKSKHEKKEMGDSPMMEQDANKNCNKIVVDKDTKSAVMATQNSNVTNKAREKNQLREEDVSKGDNKSLADIETLPENKTQNPKQENIKTSDKPIKKENKSDISYADDDTKSEDTVTRASKVGKRDKPRKHIEENITRRNKKSSVDEGTGSKDMKKHDPNVDSSKISNVPLREIEPTVPVDKNKLDKNSESVVSQPHLDTEAKAPSVGQSIDHFNKNTSKNKKRNVKQKGHYSQSERYQF